LAKRRAVEAPMPALAPVMRARTGQKGQKGQRGQRRRSAMKYTEAKSQSIPELLREMRCDAIRSDASQCDAARCQ
jgi:hypothetical protein